MLKIEPKSFSTMNPNAPIFCSNPPLAPAARCWRGVPESSPARLNVPTNSRLGILARVMRISVFADDGGATRPSQTGSPGSILAATVPSTASTGMSLSSCSHSRNIFKVSSIGLVEDDGPDGCGPADCASGDCGGGGGGGDGGAGAAGGGDGKGCG